MGDVQYMIMVDPIATLIANLLAIPKVCLAEVGDRGRGHSGHVLNLWKWKIKVINVGARLLNGIRTSSLPELPKY
jgi:hypothetical protein